MRDVRCRARDYLDGGAPRRGGCRTPPLIGVGAMAWNRRIGIAATSLCLVTAAALAGGPPAAGADPGTVMLVVKSPTSLSAGDAAVQARMVAAGHTVTRADDNTVTAAQAGAVDLVIISSSVVDTALGSRLVGVPTPTLVAKPYLLDNYQLTGPVAETDYGSRVAGTLARLSTRHIPWLPVATARCRSRRRPAHRPGRRPSHRRSRGDGSTPPPRSSRWRQATRSPTARRRRGAGWHSRSWTTPRRRSRRTRGRCSTPSVAWGVG